MVPMCASSIPAGLPPSSSLPEQQLAVGKDDEGGKPAGMQLAHIALQAQPESHKDKGVQHKGAQCNAITYNGGSNIYI